MARSSRSYTSETPQRIRPLDIPFTKIIAGRPVYGSDLPQKIVRCLLAVRVLSRVFESVLVLGRARAAGPTYRKTGSGI